MTRAATVVLVVLSGGFLAGCATDGPSDESGRDWVVRIDSQSVFDSLATDQREVKFLAPVDPATSLIEDAPECLFQDTRRYPLHLDFLRGAVDSTIDWATYEHRVLHRSTRTDWAGVLTWDPLGVNPRDGGFGVAVWRLQSADGASDVPLVSDLVAVQARLERCAPHFAGALFFSPSSQAESDLVDAFGSEVGLQVVRPTTIETTLTYSEGTAFGRLRVIPPGQAPTDLGEHDIVVIDIAPGNNATVGGLITRLPQSYLSHFNVRMRERRAPSVTAPAAQLATLDAWHGRWVQVTATGFGLVVEPSSRAAAMGDWSERPTRTLPIPPVNRTDETLRSLSEVGLEFSDRIGGKAAGIGELHRALPAPHRPIGFAVPFAVYDRFLRESGLDEEIQELLAAQSRQPVDLTQTLAQLRSRMRAAPLPSGFSDALYAAIGEHLGPGSAVHRTRFRSSANLEDLPSFAGAGLYRSASGCVADDLDGDDDGPSACLSEEERAETQVQLDYWLAENQAEPGRAWVQDIIVELSGDLNKEKSVVDAIRKVWASAWSLEAYQERQFMGIPHSDVAMAVVVSPAFVLERVNAVAVSDAGRVVLESQAGFDSVVAPMNPSALTEWLEFDRTSQGPTNIEFVTASSYDPTGAGLWTHSELSTLNGLLGALDAHYQVVAPHYLPLQTEIKITADGTVVIKQVRPDPTGL